jgi:hypothetical protein
MVTKLLDTALLGYGNIGRRTRESPADRRALWDAVEALSGASA